MMTACICRKSWTKKQIFVVHEGKPQCIRIMPEYLIMQKQTTNCINASCHMTKMADMSIHGKKNVMNLLRNQKCDETDD